MDLSSSQTLGWHIVLTLEGLFEEKGLKSFFRRSDISPRGNEWDGKILLSMITRDDYWIVGRSSSYFKTSTAGHLVRQGYRHVRGGQFARRIHKGSLLYACKF